MKESGYVVAVIGADGEIGQQVQAVLRERRFAVGEWRLFGGAVGVGDQADDDDAPELLEPARIDLAGADLAFMCATDALSREWTPRGVAAQALVIDLTQAFADRVDVPLVVPEVNADAIAEAMECHIVTSPASGATALSVVLKPIDDAARLKRVVVAGYEPVSSAGRNGIDELAQQTRDLLSGRSAERAVFPHRTAFNVIPQVGEFMFGGRTTDEWQIETQVRRLLDLPDLPIVVTSVRVPTFFGQGYALNVETEYPIDAERTGSILQQAPGIMLHGDTTAPSYPTLVEVLDSEATHVGRIRDDPTVPYGISLWVAIDGLRKGGAVNAVQIAECAVAGHQRAKV